MRFKTSSLSAPKCQTETRGRISWLRKKYCWSQIEFSENGKESDGKLPSRMCQVFTLKWSAVHSRCACRSYCIYASFSSPIWFEQSRSRQNWATRKFSVWFYCSDKALIVIYLMPIYHQTTERMATLNIFCIAFYGLAGELKIMLQDKLISSALSLKQRIYPHIVLLSSVMLLLPFNLVI